ncbi:hypothetical protein GETHOR_13510 [Geothrix oryzae]|uniref:Uncharacterized protein n=1 Tax=Geothrix oryzae TaxID=2927975 RepID=A0ABM8DQH1_9BACT|nr:hypothetical protein [Geothrix oryzae]BDU69250.1 hypothetical protein GETHOR_13510 [Geothrix oryzae]
MNASPLLVGLLLTTSMACLAPKRKADFEANLNRWVGRPATEFIRANGNPSTTSARPDGGKTYVFAAYHQKEDKIVYREFHNTTTHESVQQAPGATPPEWVNNSSDGIQTRKVPVSLTSNLYCRVVLEADARGTILSTKYEGNDCW